MTSHDVVGVIRRRFATRAVGHTGTLDPFATGLLILVLGRATRLARFVEADRKRYQVTMRLGVTTETDDLTGAPLGAPWTGPWPGRAAVDEALAGEVGTRVQRPPAYSAKQVAGRRGHEAARRGAPLDLPGVTVTVHSVGVLEYDPPMVKWETTTGPGAYVRAMARDVGVRLGCGAHLSALRREAIGRFDVTGAVALEAVTGDETLIPAADLVGTLGRVPLGAEDADRVRHGRRVGEAGEGGFVALMTNGDLLAVAEARDGQWQPVVVLG